MGITRELARSVFSKSRSFGAPDHTNVRNSSTWEKRRWSSVRSYLCGDEFNSVIAEEDSASVRSSEFTVSNPLSESFGTTIFQMEPETENSEATVTQPIVENLSDEGEIQREDAALVIQSAFRGHLARRRNEELNSMESKEAAFSGAESPSRASMGTSVEVQTGNSTEVFSTREEIMAVHHRLKQKARTNTLKLKEDWDDSTVSSNITKLRIQNRLEAMTRRERALAYAFSQQLRICSKKKQNRSDDAETSMGWSWLERWMATRIQESESFESNANNHIEPVGIARRSSMIRSRFFDLPKEEMESCGSNEVSVQMDSNSISTRKEKSVPKISKNRLKATRSVSRRKTVRSFHCPREFSKDEKDKKYKLKQMGSIRETKCNDATSQLPLDVVTCNYSKLGH